MRLITAIIDHQTGYPNDTVESITRWHTTPPGPDPAHPLGLGWSHIGYHFVITPDAKVHKTLAQGLIGNHCRGDNFYSIGICCVGKGSAFPLDQGYMTYEMFCALLKLHITLRKAYPLIKNNIFGHNEKSSGTRQGKPCPGWDMKVMRDHLLRA